MGKSKKKNYRFEGPKPIKKLGQHFLRDGAIAAKIVDAAGIEEGDIVLEIGPGRGALTRALLDIEEVKSLIAVEKDEGMLPFLQPIQTEYGERISILHGDALAVSERQLAEMNSGKLRIIANLPYNISTELLFKWLGEIELFSGLTVMLQYEVAKRVTAQAHSSSYGWLSVLAQQLCEVEMILSVPPEAFWPQPKVRSGVVKLTPRKKMLYPCDLKKLKIICSLLFVQRRKVIANVLKYGKAPYLLEVLPKLQIDSRVRPEELTIEQLCALSEYLE